MTKSNVSVAEAPDAVVDAVPALAQTLKGAPLQASSEQQASQATAGSTPEMQSQSPGQGDAALQLDALQVLLLFLPLPIPQVSAALLSSCGKTCLVST